MDGEQEQDDSLETRLERLWSDETASFSSAAQAAEAPFADRYEIIRVIGAGAFGMVYLAFDLECQEEVALKLPRPEVLLDAPMRNRFATEAMLVSKLNHPNIVRLREARTSTPLCYIASDYCNGPDLQKWLNHSQPAMLDWRSVANFMATVADAVHYAHENKVVHRDLKPANILLATAEAQGGEPGDSAGSYGSSESDRQETLDRYEPKLTDFGLAKISEASLTATRSSFIAGTPVYMAPEQFESGHERDGRNEADIYSLGVILFELLTRHLPIAGERYTDFVDGHRNRRPHRVSEFRKDLPRSLQRICSKCLEKNPRVRYQTAGQLADDLRACAEGRSPKIQTAKWRERFSHWSSRPARIEIAGWFQIWSSLILCSWMLVVVNASPWFISISDTDLWSLRWDVLQLSIIRTPIYLWLGWQVVRRRSWAVWTMAFANTIRALLVLRMLGQPTFFLPLYGEGGLMPFVDHFICLIVLAIQAVLSWLALRAQLAKRMN